MGRRGPAPAPTALKLVKGVHKHNPDRVNTSEPAPAEITVSAPEWLSPAARAIWSQYAPDLERQSVLKAWDVEHFATWCDLAAKRRVASAKIDELGAVVPEPMFTKSGEFAGTKLVRNPWTLVEKACTDSMSRYGARFGLSPSDRSQLKVGDAENANPKGRLLTS